MAAFSAAQIVVTRGSSCTCTRIGISVNACRALEYPGVFRMTERIREWCEHALRHGVAGTAMGVHRPDWRRRQRASPCKPLQVYLGLRQRGHLHERYVTSKPCSRIDVEVEQLDPLPLRIPHAHHSRHSPRNRILSNPRTQSRSVNIPGADGRWLSSPQPGPEPAP